MSIHVLKHENKILCSLMDHLKLLQEFNALLTEYLPPELAKHCQVVKYEKSCLFVMVDNGHWTTQLRFNIPDLMTHLRKTTNLHGLSGIICKTRPQQVIGKTSKPKVKTITFMSPETATDIMEIAKSIKDEKIRKILERIAGRSK